MSFNPTPEQINIQCEFIRPDHPSLKIQAYAGAGKTSTLKLLANSGYRRGLYLAFNKRNAVEAQADMPDNVKASTTHSLAYKAMKAWRFNDKMNVRLPAPLLAEQLGIETIFDIDPAYSALSVRDTVKRFCNSANPHVDKQHVDLRGKGYKYFRRWAEEHLKHLSPVRPDGSENPGDITPFGYAKEPIANLSPLDKMVLGLIEGYRNKLLDKARDYWHRATDDADSAFPATHDTYLKLYQLNEPVIRGYSYIMLDEGQDTNPCVLDIFERQQHMQRVIVGDTYQGIYEFRGAVTAMETTTADVTLHLSQSFRFGHAIAEVANRILGTVYQPEVPLRGNPGRDSRIVDDMPAKHAVIARTNAGVFWEAYEALSADKSIAVIGSLKEPIDMMESAYALSCGKMNRVTHPDIKAFDNYHDFRIEAKDNGIGWIAKLVDAEGDNIPEICAELRDAGETSPKRADLVISTGHKSKGLEFPAVKLAEDFCGDSEDEPVDPSEVASQEINLLYVAATRALDQLQPNALVQRMMEDDATPTNALATAS